MKIKKITVIILSAAIILSLTACQNRNSENKSSTDSQEITISQKSKKALEDIIDYIEITENSIEDTKDIFNNDWTDAESYEDREVIIDKLDKIYDKICVMKEDVEDIQESDYEELQMTFDVAEQYFTELEACYSDLLKLLSFSNDVIKISNLTIDNSQTGTIDEYVSSIINVSSNFSSELSKLDYPGYMKESVGNLTTVLNDYITVFENYYAAAISGDSLKISATEYMAHYTSEKFKLTSNDFFSDISMQLKKVNELLDGRMQTYQEELEKYASKQLNELVEPKYTYYDEAKKPTINYTYEDTIYPATYSTLNSVIKLIASCDQGECDVIVKVEIPDFATTYEQKVTLYCQLTQLYIKPVIDSNANLDVQKTVQMKVTITDADTGKVYVQDSNNITIMSKNDLELFDIGGEDGSCYNVLAWMTPESDAILNLKRVAIDWLTYDTSGAITSLKGYQGASTLVEAIENTAAQALALQNAMSALGVRYNMDSYSSSTSDKALQRVMYPSEVIENKSGICIETSLVIASALQSAGFNVMLIMPPGHCFVAVEAWPKSGEYIKIETTCLPTSSFASSDYIVYLTKEAWQNYITTNGCTVVDCSLAKEIGFVPYFN